MQISQDEIYGFSLLELLVTIALIAILTMISYPSYQHHLTAVKRKQAKITLFRLASRLEQYHALNATYQHAYNYLHLDHFNQNKDYNFAIERATINHYQLEAVPKGEQAKADKQCATLRFNDQGKVFISGNGSVQFCWNY